MLKILTIIAALVVVAAAGILIFAATRPNTFRIERSIAIKAPPEKIFAILNDFHNWTAWSPYEKLDAAMQRSLTGPTAGKGAVYAWDSDGKPGKGRMEILESAPSSRLLIQLDFFKPFEAHNMAEFTLAPVDGMTRVTWAMYGPNLFISKVMGIFVNIDKMVGKDFEVGLANLQTLAEQ
jgi:uncharacterized protein YndB with AHSA1/START domain